ncbi:MAG: hypothetical protein SynsKO_00620 [Synoicihabitans sp.]
MVTESPITSHEEPWNRKTVIAAGVLLIVALVVGLYAAGSSQRQIYLVNHTHQVLSKIHETGAMLRNAESEQRGFLITGGAGYEQRAEEFAEQLDASLQDLKQLVSDNPTQTVRAAQLEDIIFQRLTELRATALITKRTSIAEVKDILGDEAEVEVMSEIRKLQEQMIAEEEYLLAQRRDAMEWEIRFATITILFSGGLALLLGLIAFVIMRRSIEALNREAKLLREKESAESADREKSEFLANMSHEIRTPMNSVLGFAELLSGTVKTSKQRQYVDAINSSGRAMLSLINDILDLSKIEAGKISLNYQPISLPVLFEEIQEIFSPQAEARGLDFNISVSDRVPSVVEFDQTRLRQILFNVVGNSLKFTRNGSIEISADATIDPTDETRVKLIITVSDTGIGIPLAFQEKVFEPFRQVEEGSNRNHGGTGLGLSITQRLTELLEGEVELESGENKGTTFRFTFPRVAISSGTPEEELKIPEDEDFNRLRPSLILVADDVPLNLELIAGHFENTSHRLVFARNGKEALKQAKRHHPDLILLDIRMPEMDGRTTLAHIREQEVIKDTPIISVTASSMMAEELELRKVFDGYLRKPFTREALFKQVAQHLPLRETTNTSSKSTPPRPDSTPPQITATPNAQWPELVEKLRKFEGEKYPALSQSMSGREIAVFARELVYFGQKSSCPAVVAYGEKLKQQVEKFQIAAMEATLRGYPQLVQGIADQIDSKSP